MSKVVISQPMYFPWVGLFEQLRLADVFVHYDDVQMPLGRSFISRVQIRTAAGSQWLSVPVHRKGPLIREAHTDETQRWRERHLRTLQHAYARAPHGKEMLDLAAAVYSQPTELLSELNIFGIELIASYLGLRPRFVRATELQAKGHSTARLLELMRHLNGTVYITGHGARNYLDHERFEAGGIRVEYMDYQRAPYPQVHGGFDPHVSILDLLANVGRDATRWIVSPSIEWRRFLGSESSSIVAK